MNQSKTQARLKSILLGGIHKPDDTTWHEKLKCHFIPRARIWRDLGHEAATAYDHAKHDEFLAKFCWRLFDATSDVDNHFLRLDAIYTELFHFQVYLQPDQTIEYLAKGADTILQRLPRQPLGLPGLSKLPQDYFDAEAKDAPTAEDYYIAGSVLWPCLKVTSNFSTNVLNIVLFREVYKAQGTDGVEEKQLVDLTAEVLHHCCQLEKGQKSEDRAVLNRWLIVRCFLWASWQRAQALYFYRILYYRLAHGVNTDLGSLTVLRSTMVAPDLSIQQFSDEIAFHGKTHYMCSWAFNLLRTDGIAIGSDFRLLHKRFDQLLGHNRGRCVKESPESCKGARMAECQRFRADVENQSSHDDACHGDCPRLIWDKNSYLSVNGGRAVDATCTDFDSLKYCAASERTLAITHAWAHGQGGRPSTGLNQCLHIRYVQLADAHHCDSYFLDTACIPEGHDLRKEAIRNINETFRRAKTTLVVDKDLLTVDISNMYTELQERLLASILVSDWNVRAWTLLEALKGQRNIHILCKDALSVSYRELVQGVADKGRIDIAIFALLAPHLIVWSSNEGRDDVEKGETLEFAGSLLSYRPASRSDDDLVIWSLMIDNTDVLTKDAEGFWSNQFGRQVSTGYLVSSAERVGKKGLSWAPKTPYAVPKEDSIPSEKLGDVEAAKRFFRAFTGEETEYADISELGILAEWYTYEFENRFWKTCAAAATELFRHGSFRQLHRADAEAELNYIRFRYLIGYRYGALVQPKILGRQEAWSMHQHIAEYSGGVRGTLMAILGSNKRQPTTFHRQHNHVLDQWEWLAVYEWPSEVELPTFDGKLLWIA